MPIELRFSDEIGELLVKIKKSSYEVNQLIGNDSKSQVLHYSGETFGRIRLITNEGKKIVPKDFCIFLSVIYYILSIINFIIKYETNVVNIKVKTNMIIYFKYG